MTSIKKGQDIKMKKGAFYRFESGFTLIELLVVIAIIAILAVVVVLTLNPAEMLKKARDSNRVSDLSTLNTAINFYDEDRASSHGNAESLGTSSLIYLSIPDPAATTSAGSDCSSLGFPLSKFHCAGPAFYRKSDGTGWIPINFASTSVGSPLTTLPVDPMNTYDSGEYYEYATNGITWELMANPESAANASSSGYVAGNNLSLLSSIASKPKPGVLSLNASTTVSPMSTSTKIFFSGTANEVVNLVTAWSADTNLYMDILAPDGSELTGWGNKGSPVDIRNLVLPSTGTYTAFVYTNNGNSVPSVTLTLSQNVTEGTIAMNSSLTVSGGAMPGQSVLTTFSGTANEVVNLVTAWSADTNLYMDILAPDGSELTGWGNKGSPVDIRNLVLPSTGTYTVVIYTNNNISIPSVTLTLSQNVTEGTIAMNSSLTVSGGAMPGQSVLTTFSGTANEVVNLLTAWSVDTNLYMDILAPDGSELTGWGNKGSSVNISSPALPSTGTYTVVVYTNNNINVPSLTFTLSD